MLLVYKPDIRGRVAPEGGAYKPQHAKLEGDLTNLLLVAKWLFWQHVNDVITVHILFFVFFFSFLK